MICPCCRRDVEFVRASYWHGDSNMCRECFARWHDPDNDQITDTVSIGNHVRLRYGLPPLAAALAILLAFTPAAQASKHCLDRAEAGRTWPNRALTLDGDGCWTYDRRPPPVEAGVSIQEEPPAAARDPTLGHWWLQSELVLAELEQLEMERTSRAEPPSPQGPKLAVRHLAVFVALVLATVSVLEVAAWRPGESTWPRWRTPRKDSD
jgi:hypothetical protein